jgi:hypothetical protein
MCVVQVPSLSSICKNGSTARPITIGRVILCGPGKRCIEYRQLTPLRGAASERCFRFRRPGCLPLRSESQRRRSVRRKV